MLIILIQFSMLENVNGGSRMIPQIKKSMLRCNSDQTYERFHLNFHMFIFLIQFSALQNLNIALRQISRIKKVLDVTIVIKIMKHFILIVAC